MVRINLVDPSKLSDQHLIAEYNEILMLLGYVRKNPSPKNIPQSYRLGKGHITFFVNKLKYLKKRHEEIKKEMINRGFKPTKKIDLHQFPKKLHNNWTPSKKDIDIITNRLEEKLRKKPSWYRHHGTNKNYIFFIELLRK
jgi:deoxyribonuclease (pyrimidine dimer)